MEAKTCTHYLYTGFAGHQSRQLQYSFWQSPTAAYDRQPAARCNTYQQQVASGPLAVEHEWINGICVSENGRGMNDVDFSANNRV